MLFCYLPKNISILYLYKESRRKDLQKALGEMYKKYCGTTKNKKITATTKDDRDRLVYAILYVALDSTNQLDAESSEEEEEEEKEEVEVEEEERAEEDNDDTGNIESGGVQRHGS